MSLSNVYWRKAWTLLCLTVPYFLTLLDNSLTFLLRAESMKLVFQHHQSACWILSLYLLTWKKNPHYLLNQQSFQCCAELTEVDIQNLTPVQSRWVAIREMKDWNKQSDEPESSAGRILTVYLQVGELPKTSELIFWEVCVEAFICFGFQCGKMTHSFMYCIVTCASTTNIKQYTHIHTNK